MIRARTLDELIDVASLLSAQPVPRGRRVALVTNAGGLGILAADACEAAGPRAAARPSEETRAALADGHAGARGALANPIDMLGGANAESFEQALPPVLADPAFDAVIVLFVPTVGTDEEEVGAAISRAAATAEDKPVLCAFLSAKGAPRRPAQRRARPVLRVSRGGGAARSAARSSAASGCGGRPATVPELERDREEAPSRRARRRSRPATAGSTPSRRAACSRRTAFRSCPSASPPRRRRPSRRRASSAIPVVLKTAAPGAHKTEQGGVALDLADEAAVRAAAERIGAPLLVQPFVRGGAELLAGAVQDPVFGPLVAFGPGGVLAELIGEAQFRLAPLTDLDAEELVRSGKAGRLVAGFRGTPPADEGALVDLLLRLSLLAEELPEVAELDLNPVLALPDRCVAVDARVRVAEHDPARRTKSW